MPRKWESKDASPVVADRREEKRAEEGIAMKGDI